MNMDKFTVASRTAISNAQMLAAKHNNQQILPLHFLSVLLSDESGIVTGTCPHLRPGGFAQAHIDKGFKYNFTIIFGHED